MIGNLKGPRPFIARGMRQQKGASPSKARHQILNIFIIHIELKSYVPSVLKYLKYYNEGFINVLHEKTRSIKLFQSRNNML